MAERQFLTASVLRLGQRVYIEPQRANTPRGFKLQGALTRGMATLTPWLLDVARRGQVHAFSGPPENLSEAEQKERVAAIAKMREEEAEATDLSREMEAEMIAAAVAKAEGANHGV